MEFFPLLSDLASQAAFLSQGHALLTSCGVGILVAGRLAGVLFVGPWFGQKTIPWQVRLCLVVMLTLVVTPQISSQASNRLPIELTTMQQADEVTNFASIVDVVASPARFFGALICDTLTGAAIGVGVCVFLSGLKLAIEWFDRHSGLGMGNLLNPEFSEATTGPGQMALLLCLAAMLVMQPVNGHLLIVRLVLDSFHALPVGTGQLPVSIVELPGAILQQSLILGLRVAMPFAVAMSLLDLTLGMAHRTTRWSMLPLSYGLRAGTSLLVLAATLPGVQEAVETTVRETLVQASDKMTTDFTNP